MFVRRVSGNSMAPSLLPHQLVVAVRPRRLAVGDVVIFRHEGVEKIKRIHALREGQMYVLGDHPEHSTDSRHFGWLEITCIIGRVRWP
jgi:nickel-type superoxide dismutase maturation protease